MTRRDRRAAAQARLRGASARAPSIALRVDELVLRGFERGHGPGIAGAMQRELTSRLAAGGVPERWIASSRVTLRPGMSASAIGQSVARAIVGSGGRR